MIIFDYKECWMKNIITGENCRQFRLQFPLAFIGRAVHPVGGEGMWLRGDMGIVMLACYRVHFIKDQENLV